MSEPSFFPRCRHGHPVSTRDNGKPCAACAAADPLVTNDRDATGDAARPHEGALMPDSLASIDAAAEEAGPLLVLVDEAADDSAVSYGA